MGEGKVQWWPITTTEGRELRFCEQLMRAAGRTGLLASGTSLDQEEWSEGGALVPPEGVVGEDDGPIQAWVPQKKMQVRMC